MHWFSSRSMMCSEIFLCKCQVWVGIITIEHSKLHYYPANLYKRISFQCVADLVKKMFLMQLKLLSYMVWLMFISDESDNTLYAVQLLFTKQTFCKHLTIQCTRGKIYMVYTKCELLVTCIIMETVQNVLFLHMYTCTCTSMVHMYNVYNTLTGCTCITYM